MEVVEQMKSLRNEIIDIECEVVLDFVTNFFGDKEKATLWFRTPNPMLGNISPLNMIRVGRFKKLLRFIQNSLLENQPK